MSKGKIYAYVDLLKRENGGHAFLKIMRGFERTAEKRVSTRARCATCPTPVQVVLGAEDPALKLAVHGEQAGQAVGLEETQTVPAKHFLQENRPPRSRTESPSWPAPRSA
jgi:hypothetical protein